MDAGTHLRRHRHPHSPGRRQSSASLLTCPAGTTPGLVLGQGPQPWPEGEAEPRDGVVAPRVTRNRTCRSSAPRVTHSRPSVPPAGRSPDVAALACFGPNAAAAELGATTGGLSLGGAVLRRGLGACRQGHGLQTREGTPEGARRPRRLGDARQWQSPGEGGLAHGSARRPAILGRRAGMRCAARGRRGDGQPVGRLGQCRLLHLPATGRLPSIRLAALGEGMHDYEYLWLHRRSLQAAALDPSQPVAPAALARARALLERPIDAVRTSPDTLMAHRGSMARAIEALQGSGS